MYLLVSCTSNGSIKEKLYRAIYLYLVQGTLGMVIIIFGDFKTVNDGMCFNLGDNFGMIRRWEEGGSPVI